MDNDAECPVFYSLRIYFQWKTYFGFRRKELGLHPRTGTLGNYGIQYNRCQGHKTHRSNPYVNPWCTSAGHRCDSRSAFSPRTSLHTVMHWNLSDTYSCFNHCNAPAEKEISLEYPKEVFSSNLLQVILGISS